MGDRGNIVMERDDDMFPHPLFMYTHWAGSAIKPTLQDALIRGKGRWDDGPYLARIIFCELIQENVLGETGFGLSTAIGDGSHDLLCVNVAEQKVKERRSAEDPGATVIQEWTFEEFVAAKFDE